MSINLKLSRFVLILNLLIFDLFFRNALAQGIDHQYRCQGRVNQDQRKVVILNLNLRLGGLTVDGDLNGDAIVGSVFENSNSLIKIIAGRKSEMVGNRLAPIHKVTVNISKLNGSFDVEVLGVNGYSYFLSGSGLCQ